MHRQRNKANQQGFSKWLRAALMASVSATVLLPVAQGYGETIEVGPGQSIQSAINRAGPGSTIRVAPGTYAPFDVTKNNIRIESVTKGGAHIVATGHNQPAIGSYGQSNVAIDGFRLTSRGGDGVKIGGSPGRMVSGIQFTNNTTEYARLDGIKFFQADRVDVSGNRIVMAGGGGRAGSAGNRNGDGGVDWVQVTNSVMQGNEVRTNGWACAMVKNGSSGNTIKGNRFSGCEVNGIDMSAPSSGKAAAANKSGLTAFNNLIEGNLIASGSGCAISMNAKGTRNNRISGNKISGRECGDPNGTNNQSANVRIISPTGAPTLGFIGGIGKAIGGLLGGGSDGGGGGCSDGGGLFDSFMDAGVALVAGGPIGAAASVGGEAGDTAKELSGCPIIESFPGAVEIQAIKTAVEAVIQTKEAIAQTTHQANMLAHSPFSLVDWLLDSWQDFLALLGGESEAITWEEPAVRDEYEAAYPENPVFETIEDLGNLRDAQDNLSRATSVESKRLSAKLAEDIEDLSGQLEALEGERGECPGQTCVADINAQIGIVMAQLSAKTALMQAAHNRVAESVIDSEREARKAADATWDLMIRDVGKN
jgi:hypothetical protein